MESRNLLLCVACGAAICWGLMQLSASNSAAVIRSAVEEPALIGGIFDASPLRDIQQSNHAVYYDSGVGGQVRPASASSIAALSVATQAAGQAGAITWQVKQDEFIWPSIGSRSLLLKSEANFTLYIEGDKPTLRLDAQPVDKDDIVSDGANNKWKLPLSFELKNARQIEITQGTSVETITIVRPQPSVGSPSVGHLSNNEFTVPGIFNSTTNTAAKPVSVYNRYLKLKGFGLDAGTELRFYVFEKVGVEYKLLRMLATPFATINPAPNGAWEGELRLPPPEFLQLKQAGVLVMAAVNPNRGHQFSQQLVHFVIEEADEDLLKLLTVAPVTGSGKPVKFVDEKYYSDEESFEITITPESAVASTDPQGEVVILLGERRQTVRPPATKSGNAYTAKVTVDGDGPHQLRAGWGFGDKVSKESEPITVNVRARPPSANAIEPLNFASTPGAYKITIRFDVELAASVLSDHTSKFFLNDSNNTPQAFADRNPATLSSDARSLILSFKKLTPDNYELYIPAAGIVDRFGNTMAKEIRTGILNPIGGEEPITSRGITGPTGKYVEFPEYTDPRPFVEGFNASDRVETRVARLYYYRDAHRVAQIVNRNVKSYNRAAVDMAEQRADKSRQLADQATDDRRSKEREAVRAAQKTREAEQEFQQAQSTAERLSQDAAASLQEANRLESQRPIAPSQPPATTEAELDRRINQARNAANSLDNIAGAARQRAAAAYDKVQRLREEEAQSSEQWQRSIATEDRAREEQFRREVAAARADPDTYVPGRPASTDPVEQVSVSVIGEGLIQLRGPIKGINNIRTMINQIDAPVGQVRVGVHSVQINGEKGDRMERVAGKIQRYIDHSRFLTLQSAEMLRKAIVQVAAQKAVELGNVPGLTQEERDRSYLYAFFGDDFIHELEAMDSEFLHTGNKLLSIHSMDSTSLASAMFIMALAKNSTRMQILQTFEGMMAGELPMAEQSYFEAGLTCDGKEKLFGKYCSKDEFCMLSENARFQSIRGMFNAELGADDTMTPIQREFVRLAQIFKSRLIVEMELKQRVIERSVIEERLGDRKAELLEAKQREDDAKRKLQGAERLLIDGQKASLVAVASLQSMGPELRLNAQNARDRATRQSRDISKLIEEIINPYLTKVERFSKDETEDFNRQVAPQAKPDCDAAIRTAKERLFGAPNLDQRETLGDRLVAFEDAVQRATWKYIKQITRTQQQPDKAETTLGGTVTFRDRQFSISLTPDNKVLISPGEALAVDFDALRADGLKIRADLARFRYESPFGERLDRANRILDDLESPKQEELVELLFQAWRMFELYESCAEHLAKEKIGQIIREIDRIAASAAGDPSKIDEVIQDWLDVQQQFADETLLNEAPEAFRRILQAKVDYQFAQRQAEASRRPLDHKKFLDMLVDEMEDKYIELLEGTRAHTANIDAYIKRLMTSLDDDFNTQFYYPTFRKVREASQMWDVQMGQVETTTVLANNRAFAKVSPEATMEFDLPKRDIVIAEAMNGAKAMMDDFGALAQDPTFLAMAQMRGGAPTSTQMGGASGGQSTVRNVLPGLSTDTAESVMGQQGPGGSQFGAAMEALIPDPAIYKFETGTGWEIRPVIQPDGQALVFHFNYMYTTNIREPVRADEKHLGRVKRHFVDTDVQLSNFELREISRYTVALKASRTSRGVPLFEDIPLVGVLFRPQPSDESSLQQNIIMGQATIFPTVFDLMGLRWAPVVADLDPLRLSNDEFIVRNRRRALMNRVFDHSSSKVDEFLRIPEAERRMDLYRSQETIPSTHPDGYNGPGANLRDSQLQEGYDPTRAGESQFAPGQSGEGNPYLRSRRRQPEQLYEVPLNQPHAAPGPADGSSSRRKPGSPDGVTNVEYRSPAGEPRYPGQQVGYMATQPIRNEPRPALRMQRLPTVDGSPRPLPGTVTRPVAR